MLDSVTWAWAVATAEMINFSMRRISIGTKITIFASRYPTKLYSTQRLALHYWSCILTNYLISNPIFLEVAKDSMLIYHLPELVKYVVGFR